MLYPPRAHDFEAVQSRPMIVAGEVVGLRTARRTLTRFYQHERGSRNPPPIQGYRERDTWVLDNIARSVLCDVNTKSVFHHRRVEPSRGETHLSEARPANVRLTAWT